MRNLIRLLNGLLGRRRLVLLVVALVWCMVIRLFVLGLGRRIRLMRRARAIRLLVFRIIVTRLRRRLLIVV